MSYTFRLPIIEDTLYKYDSRVRYVPVLAETVGGLMVHRDEKGRGWNVSTRNGLAIAGAPVTRPIATRDRARYVARILGPMLPEVLRAGLRTGNDWKRENEAEAAEFLAERNGLTS